MDTLLHLNAFISERLKAVAVEIFGAVEKTLLEHQREISRSKHEIDHPRPLVLWPQVRSYRSAHHLSPHSCDTGVSPKRGCEEDQAPDMSTKDQVPLHVKEEHHHRTDQLRPSCRQQRDATTSPQTVRRYSHKGLPSQLYRNADQRADIKAEAAGDEYVISPLTREAKIHCGIHAELCERQQESLQDPLEIPDEQYPEQDWSPFQDLDPRQIDVARFQSSSPLGERAHEYNLPLQSKSSVVNGESVEVQALKRLRTTERKRSSSYSKERDRSSVEEDVNDMNRDRRHACPICAKRFKESSHLKEHVRIHTGEKPYQCKQCGVNFRQSGALTLHMRIHTGERPYQCTDCGRRFNRKGDMETHRVTHTGERPHPCMLCGKSFRRKSNLNTHVKIHADGKNDHTEPV
ncbi:zinc finger protein 177-like isoform X2 [Channa argus]|uniref:zinc finger protein 177-like isoform X2 n=1 Tax=Channa argus TaxID=215402 RepID=UPI00352214D4